MSMIGNTLLNEIIKEHKIYSPNKILTELHNRILESLRSNEKLSYSYDGMDIVITFIDTKNKEVILSSANQYAFVFADNKLHTFFGDIFSIGDPLARTINIKFEEYKIKFNNKISIFFSSDGYFDQFGGKENKKFSLSSFIKLLHKIHNLQADKQKEILNETFQEWKRENNQIDDIIVVGINI